MSRRARAGQRKGRSRRAAKTVVRNCGIGEVDLRVDDVIAVDVA